jgi:hypothetical protein
VSQIECYGNDDFRLCSSNICLRKTVECPITDLSYDKSSQDLVARRDGPVAIKDLRTSLNTAPCSMKGFLPHRKTYMSISHHVDYPFIRSKVSHPNNPFPIPKEPRMPPNEPPNVLQRHRDSNRERILHQQPNVEGLDNSIQTL